MMKTLPSLVRPLPAVLISLLWPWLPGVYPASAQEKTASAPQVELLDTDNDGLSDKWEMDFFRDLGKGAGDDPDGDTLENLLEYEVGTNPLLADSNGDGQPDWAGIAGYLYQEKWPEPEGPNPRDYYPRHLFDAPGAATFFHPGAAVYGKNERFFRQRLRGRLLAPVSGDYEFFISGNNWCELWLGEDAGRFGVRRLAGLGTHPKAGVERSEFGKFPDQKSVPVKLVAGREYYIEILHRTRSDAAYHLSVAWKPPGANKCAAIPQSALRSWVPEPEDSADDGMGDAWKRQHGLAAGRNVAMEDPDGDGIVNGKVRALDGDPLAASAIPGALSWSRWFNPKGITASSLDLADLRRTAAADRAPDFRCASSLVGMRLPSGAGGVVPTMDRLQGTLTVPETGLYSFWVMGKAAAELSLSTDAHAFLKRPLIRRTRNSGDGSLVLNGCEAVRSVPVFLEEGRPCFIETLYTPEFGSQRLHVQWKRHEERSWSQSELSGGVSGQWTDRDGVMIASVQGPLSFGGSSGDRLLFRYSPADGVSEAFCRLESLGSLAPGAGGGLMFRSSLDPFAPFVAVTLGSDRKFGFHGRTAELAPEQSKYSRPYSGARFRLEDSVWLRLRSDGGHCTASYSGDGVRWTAVGSMKAALGGEILAGPVAWGAYGSESAEVVVSHMALGGLQPAGEIPASAFSTAGIDPLDRDGDGLPDAWERGQELDPAIAHGADGPQGDPDVDGFTNHEEYRLGGNPREPGGFTGYLTRELWRVKGSLVADLTGHPAFKGEPHLRDLVSRLDLQGGDGDQNYGQRLRGTIIAPVSGTYRFWLAGDNGCSLSLSTDAGRYSLREIASLSGTGGQSTGLHDWEKFPSQRSAEIRLEGGQEYHIEILHKEGAGGDHVAVAWDYQANGGRIQPREILPSRVLKSMAPDKTDADDDLLPDEWEVRFGLSPRDNGFHDPIREGAEGDFDRDRLTNRKEFLLGTNPCKSDTDGDGVDDRDEIDLFHTDPLKKDAAPPAVIVKIPPGSSLPGGPRWMVSQEDGSIHSMDRRGESVWEFEVAAAGIYQVALSGWSESAKRQTPGIPVSIRVDGIQIGRGVLKAGPVVTRISHITRWLAAGRHRMSVFNHNVRSGVSMVVSSMEILAMTGGDADGDGMPDWLEDSYLKLDHAQPPSGGFVTSPACLEGMARYFEDLSIRTADGVELDANRGLSGRWYVDVPLDPHGAARELDLSFEGGAIGGKIDLTWSETNLLGENTEFQVRHGDSMRLTAYDPKDGMNGTVFNLSSKGVALHRGDANKPFVHKFETEGRHEMSVEVIPEKGARRVRTVAFVVSKAELGGGFPIPSDRSRTWVPPVLSASALIEYDGNLSLFENSVASGVGRTFEASFGVKVGTAGRVIARVPNGPILGATIIEGFYLAPATATGDHRLIETLADGTRVVLVSYVIDGWIPPDLSIWIQLYVPDAVFANGDTWLHLTASDFDENGRTQFKIYKAPGKGIPYVCHWIRPYGAGPGGTQDNPAEPTTGEEQ